MPAHRNWIKAKWKKLAVSPSLCRFFSFESLIPLLLSARVNSGHFYSCSKIWFSPKSIPHLTFKLNTWTAQNFCFWTSIYIWSINNLGPNPASLLMHKFLLKKHIHKLDHEQQLYLSILLACRVFSQSSKEAQSFEGFHPSCPTKKSGQMALQEK